MEGNLKNMLVTIQKGYHSLEEYLKEFKSICNNLTTIKKPINDIDKVFQFACGLGSRYETFCIVMLTKPPYLSFSQFVLALQGHEQSLVTKKEEEKSILEHAQAFFSRRSRNGQGSRGQFNSRVRGFTLGGRYNVQYGNQNKNQHPNNSPSKSKEGNYFIEQQKQIPNNNVNGKTNCQICGKANQYAIDCWYRFDYSY